MRLRYSLLLLACAACGGSDTPYAATGTGMLVDVRDEHGKLVRGAEVTTKPAISAEITDSSGTVLFDHVKPGQYKVSARDDEYGSATEVVQVASGKRARAAKHPAAPAALTPRAAAAAPAMAPPASPASAESPASAASRAGAGAALPVSRASSRSTRRWRR